CLQALVAADIPAGAINDMAQTFADPQVVSRGLRAPVHDDGRRPLDVIANPIRFASDPIENYVRPPLLGEHTDEVLSEMLGYSAEDLARLSNMGVIGRRATSTDASLL